MRSLEIIIRPYFCNFQTVILVTVTVTTADITIMDWAVLPVMD